MADPFFTSESTRSESTASNKFEKLNMLSKLYNTPLEDVKGTDMEEEWLKDQPYVKHQKKN